MNKKGYLAFSALAFAMLLASCGPKQKVNYFEDPDTGLTAKDVFNTTYGTDPTTFAAYATNHQPNAMHITNFIDGLVENDNYGVLKPALAKSIPEGVVNKETGESTYTFELKDGLEWMKWDESGKNLVKAADVKGQDFVTAAKLALNPKLDGGSSYLYFMFIKGSQEYYQMQVQPPLKNPDGSIIKDENGKPVLDPSWVAPTQKELDEFFDKNVGLKADGNKIIYTLPKDMKYFPTVLTYSCFYPVPTELYNSITSKYGTVDGQRSKNNLWYNGAFALSSLENNNHIDYVKNPTYWDKDVVTLNKVHMIKTPQEADMSWGRQKFEAGTIDGFRVNEIDVKGWEKYVTGKDGSGSIENPVHELANSRQGTPESTTFYLGFNFNRELTENTNLSISEIRNFEKAIANTNFRKAILHAVDKGVYNSRRTPSNPNQWTTNTYTIKTLAVDDHGKDYVEYLFDEYAAQEGISVEEAKATLDSGMNGLYDATLAQEYLAKAKQELGSSVTYPIQFEIVEQQNEQFTVYYNRFAESLQKSLDPTGQIVKVSTKQLTDIQMDNAFYHHDYSVSAYFGWSPDYGDPLSYLNTLVVGGDLTPNFGFSSKPEQEQALLGEFTKMVEAADKETDKQKRLELYAKAEYYLLFDQALIIPMTQRYQGLEVNVTKVKPYTGQIAPYGMGRDKLKSAVVYKDVLTKENYKMIVDKYNAGKN
ncbi:MAG: ABC transporter substrate-binding protein [Bacilli bacterium]|nr:ABC transporter substrate-binding protein [Bacilli bacterium]